MLSPAPMGRDTEAGELAPTQDRVISVTNRPCLAPPQLAEDVLGRLLGAGVLWRARQAVRPRQAVGGRGCRRNTPLMDPSLDQMTTAERILYVQEL